MRIITKLIILYVCMAVNASAQESDYTWIQYVQGNNLSARAITLDDKCPNIVIDDKAMEMNLRSEYQDIELKQKVRTCEYDVTGSKSVVIHNQQLKLPPKQINKFIMLGDTGCEAKVFKDGHDYQDCNDPESWPFKQVADQVAKQNPDFIIHMGDYAYRNRYKGEEDAFRNKQMQWFFFQSEFFKPAKNLLASAPILFIRGNHESCPLTGGGWFLFLDPNKFNEECAQYTKPYQLQIDDLNFAVFDSSGITSGTDYPKDQLERYKAEFASVAQQLNKPYFALIHHPIIGLDNLDGEAFPDKLNAPVIGDAFGTNLSKKMPIVFSGHFHIFANVTREGDNLQQFILGNGGTRLHPAKKDSYIYQGLNNKNVKGDVKIRYGYSMFERLDSDSWKMTSYAIDGTELFSKNISTK